MGEKGKGERNDRPSQGAHLPRQANTLDLLKPAYDPPHGGGCTDPAEDAAASPASAGKTGLAKKSRSSRARCRAAGTPSRRGNRPAWMRDKFSRPLREGSQLAASCLPSTVPYFPHTEQNVSIYFSHL